MPRTHTIPKTANQSSAERRPWQSPTITDAPVVETTQGGLNAGPIELGDDKAGS